MRIACRLLGLTTLTLFLCATLSAQNTRVRGELLGEDRVGIPGVVVLLERSDSGGDQVYELPPTDDRGQFVHNAITPGDYQIVFEYNDYVYQAFGRIGSGDVPIELDIFEMTYEANEFDRVSGAYALEVRDITRYRAGTVIVAAPRTEEEREDREAARAAGDNVRKAFEAGLKALEEGDYDTALAQLITAVEGGTDQHVIYGNLGLVYERLGRWDQALATYQKAQSLAEFNEVDPRDANYFPNLTLAYAQAGEIREAMETAEKVAAIDPTEGGRSFFNVGVALTNSGDSQGAFEAYKRAVDLNPDISAAYFEMALTRFTNEETIPEAIPLLEKFLELESEGEDADTARELLAFARENDG